MKWLMGLVAAFALVASARWAVAQAPPSEQVLVLRHSLGPGRILKASDLAVGSVRVSPGREATLLPASLGGLVVGEYLIKPGQAGSPLLTTDIHQVSVHYRPPPATSPSDNCVPAKAV